MFGLPFDKATMSSRDDVRLSLPIPMVYEQFPEQQLRWEYHVLTIDPREEALPEIEQLNALGQEGWTLVGILDGRNANAGAKVNYYFVRKQQEENK